MCVTVQHPYIFRNNLLVTLNKKLTEYSINFLLGSTSSIKSGLKIYKGLKMLNLIQQLKTSYTSLIHNEDGVTAIEYGLIAALIGIAAIVGITAVGTDLQALFTKIAAAL